MLILHDSVGGDSFWQHWSCWWLDCFKLLLRQLQDQVCSISESGIFKLRAEGYAVVSRMYAHPAPTRMVGIL